MRRALTIASLLLVASCGENETPQEEIDRVSAGILKPMTADINLFANMKEVPQPSLFAIKFAVSTGCAERLVMIQKEKILTPDERSAAHLRAANCETMVTKKVMSTINQAVFGSAQGPQTSAATPTSEGSSEAPVVMDENVKRNIREADNALGYTEEYLNNLPVDTNEAED